MGKYGRCFGSTVPYLDLIQVRVILGVGHLRRERSIVGEIFGEIGRSWASHEWPREDWCDLVTGAVRYWHKSFLSCPNFLLTYLAHLKKKSNNDSSWAENHVTPKAFGLDTSLIWSLQIFLNSSIFFPRYNMLNEHHFLYEFHNIPIEKDANTKCLMFLPQIHANTAGQIRRGPPPSWPASFLSGTILLCTFLFQV